MEGPEEFVINLSEVAPGAVVSGYKNRKDGGQKLPQVIVNHSDAKSQLKGKLMRAVHGKLTPDGDAASLLIFEFDLTTPGNHRFKRATVRIYFEDSEQDSENDPQVHKIVPQGMHHLNKHTDTKDITQGVDVAINANPVPAAGFNLGYSWSMSETKTKTSCALLNGMTDSIGTDKEETIAIWVMEEEKGAQQGIPTFLRTAVLLRHEAEEPRKFNIDLEIDALESSRLYGKSRIAKTLQPMWLDPTVFQGVVDDPASLDEVDLSSESVIRIAKALAV
jgi:hypothetical protein